MIHICVPAPRPQTLHGVQRAAPSLALNKYARWPEGTEEIHVRFLDGTPELHKTVREVIDSIDGWNGVCGLRFVFSGADDAPVRVSFRAGSSWSYVGQGCFSAAQDDPTLVLGWLTPDTESSETRRVVLHEFGHALGFEHEHRRPDAGIPWDYEKVYAYYLETMGWDKQMVDAQVLVPIAEEVLTLSPFFDPDSIMAYMIDPGLLTDPEFFVPYNTHLSVGDVTHAQNWYGTPLVHRAYLPHIRG